MTDSHTAFSRTSTPFSANRSLAQALIGSPSDPAHNARGHLDHGHRHAPCGKRRRDLDADESAADDHRATSRHRSLAQGLGIGKIAQQQCVLRARDDRPPRLRPGGQQQLPEPNPRAVGQGCAPRLRIDRSHCAWRAGARRHAARTSSSAPPGSARRAGPRAAAPWRAADGCTAASASSPTSRIEPVKPCRRSVRAQRADATPPPTSSTSTCRASIGPRPGSRGRAPEAPPARPAAARVRAAPAAVARSRRSGPVPPATKR